MTSLSFATTSAMTARALAIAASTLLTWLRSRLESVPPKAKMARKASRSFMLALKVVMPASANSLAIACRVRVRMAALVRVNRMAAGYGLAVCDLFHAAHKLHGFGGLDRVERAALRRDDDEIGPADRVADR